MLCLSGFELSSRWVPLFVQPMITNLNFKQAFKTFVKFYSTPSLKLFIFYFLLSPVMQRKMFAKPYRSVITDGEYQRGI